MKKNQEQKGKTIGRANARLVTPEETNEVAGGLPRQGTCCSAGCCLVGGGYDDTPYPD
jgi:hypothetical protein